MNGPLTGNDGKASARPATPHDRELAAKGEKARKPQTSYHTPVRTSSPVSQ